MLSWQPQPPLRQLVGLEERLDFPVGRVADVLRPGPLFFGSGGLVFAQPGQLLRLLVEDGLDLLFLIVGQLEELRDGGGAIPAGCLEIGFGVGLDFLVVLRARGHAQGGEGGEREKSQEPEQIVFHRCELD